MAQQDKETYDSYAKDAFDNPPAGRWASTGVRDRPHPVPCRTS